MKKLPSSQIGNSQNFTPVDDVDDDQPVIIDGVHENDDDMSHFEVPYCPLNIETPEPELKKSNESEMPKIGRGNYFPTFI